MKKMLAIVLAVVCVLTMSIPVMARGGRGFGGGGWAGQGIHRTDGDWNSGAWGGGWGGRGWARHGMYEGGTGLWGAGRHFFWDADGNFLSRDAVSANLDRAVAAGEITAAQRNFILERHEFCGAGGWGGCRGFYGYGDGWEPGFRGGGGAFCPWWN